MMRVMVVLAVLCAAVASRAEDGNARRSGEAERTAKEIRARVEAEIKTLPDHPWAGQYYEGDGLGENVTLFIAPGAGYVFEWHGCLGLYDRNYGKITEDHGQIRLSFTFKNKKEGFEGIAEKLVPIAWDGRHYLIPADDIGGFCNDVNGGREPREGMHGRYLLRQGDEQKKVKGLPAVPESYRRYLLDKPISAQITDVRAGTAKQSEGVTVVLDVGKASGLLVGMEMHAVRPSSVTGPFVVTKVDEAKAEAVVSRIWEGEQRPQKGWQLSTRCSWADQADQ